MSDNKFHLPVRRKEKRESGGIVRLSPQAYNLAVEMFNDSTMSMSQIASKAVEYAYQNAVYDKEEL